MFLIIFGCNILGFKNPACVKEITNMRYVWLDDMAGAHHSGPSDTGYLRFERGGNPRGGGGVEGSWGEDNTKTMGKVKCSYDVGRMHSESQTVTPPPNQTSLQA